MDIKSMSPLELAFVGDAVYELMVRRRIANEINTVPNTLHRLTVQYVRAEAQHHALESLWDVLDEAEQDVARRGRNATKVSVPKNSNPRDYRDATALEALFGWLYLTGNSQRAEQLFSMIGEPTPDQKTE